MNLAPRGKEKTPSSDEKLEAQSIWHHAIRGQHPLLDSFIICTWHPREKKKSQAETSDLRLFLSVGVHTEYIYYMNLAASWEVYMMQKFKQKEDRNFVYMPMNDAISNTDMISN